MSDLADLDLGGRKDTPDPHESRPFQYQDPEPRRAFPMWIPIAVGVVLLALAIWYFFFRNPPAPEPTEVADAPPPPVVAAPPPAPPPPTSRYGFDGPLPPIDESDEAVARVIRQLSAHPRIVTWLTTPRLARTFAVMIENLATGTNPSQHLGFLEPDESFRVRNDAGELRADRSNARRYDLLTSVFISLDPEGTAEAYTYLKPLIEESFADLGYPKEALDPTLEQAFANILAVQIPSGDPVLLKEVTTFVYVDPELEAQGPIAKQLVRMGRGNARRIQNQVRRLAEALGMDI